MASWVSASVAAAVAIPLFMMAPQSCSLSAPGGPDQGRVVSRVAQRNGSMVLTVKFKDGHTGQQAHVSTKDVPHCVPGSWWPRCTGEW